jgi:hypothetical protein
MISFKLQIILIVSSSFTFFILINMIKKYKVELKYSILWILISLLTISFSVFPRIFYTLSNFMGVELPVNALFLTAIFACFVILFSISLVLSKATNKIKDLSQEIGILKLELEELQRNIKNEER